MEKKELTVAQLRRPYIRVVDGERYFYGGAQSWDPNKGIRAGACGAVAATGFVSYLDGNEKVERTDFMKKMTKLRKIYFPVIPYAGMNGFGLALGMNFYFWMHKQPYLAFWGISARRRNGRIARMLQDNLPVILCIGNHLPLFWRRKPLTLYRKDMNGNFQPYTKTDSHFVTVTGMDKYWMRISSWGKELYINRAEWEIYARKYSCCVLSNVMNVIPINKTKK